MAARRTLLIENQGQAATGLRREGMTPVAPAARHPVLGSIVVSVYIDSLFGSDPTAPKGWSGAWRSSSAGGLFLSVVTRGHGSDRVTAAQFPSSRGTIDGRRAGG